MTRTATSRIFWGLLAALWSVQAAWVLTRHGGRPAWPELLASLASTAGPEAVTPVFHLRSSGTLDVSVDADLPEDGSLSSGIELVAMPGGRVVRRQVLTLWHNARYDFGEYWVDRPGDRIRFPRVPAGLYAIRVQPGPSGDAPKAQPAPRPAPQAALRVSVSEAGMTAVPAVLSGSSLVLLAVLERALRSRAREASCAC
jgi:hypothetical protein